MKKYQVKINNMELEIIQDDDGKFITPYLCIEDWGKFGSALKPSFEPIIVARKPFKGSLVDNVIEYGVGGINIDECRVGNEERINKEHGYSNVMIGGCFEKGTNEKKEYKVNGRFPANTILTYDETDFDEVCGGFPYTTCSGAAKTGRVNPNGINYSNKNNIFGGGIGKQTGALHNDSGSASRYFMNCKYTEKDEDFRRYIYTPKASKKDRDEGLNVETEEYILKEDIDENLKNNIKRLLNL